MKSFIKKRAKPYVDPMKGFYTNKNYGKMREAFNNFQKRHGLPMAKQAHVKSADYTG